MSSDFANLPTSRLWAAAAVTTVAGVVAVGVVFGGGLDGAPAPTTWTMVMVAVGAMGAVLRRRPAPACALPPWARRCARSHAGRQV